MGFVECTLPHDKVMNVFFNTMIMLKTNFNKFLEVTNSEDNTANTWNHHYQVNQD